MRTLQHIHEDIDQATERRSQLWRQLGEGLDPEAAAERIQLDELIASLWDEHRQTRARIRFGERERIVARARTEERLARAA
ncbi:MAG: hypothetical protein H0U03_04820 [Actinobacteria bacterium]|nr:hypothetical protein [Actinomycetota bacterium]